MTVHERCSTLGAMKMHYASPGAVPVPVVPPLHHQSALGRNFFLPHHPASSGSVGVEKSSPLIWSPSNSSVTNVVSSNAHLGASGGLTQVNGPDQKLSNQLSANNGGQHQQHQYQQHIDPQQHQQNTSLQPPTHQHPHQHHHPHQHNQHLQHSGQGRLFAQGGGGGGVGGGGGPPGATTIHGETAAHILPHAVPPSSPPSSGGLAHWMSVMAAEHMGGMHYMWNGVEHKLNADQLNMGINGKSGLDGSILGHQQLHPSSSASSTSTTLPSSAPSFTSSQMPSVYNQLMTSGVVGVGPPSAAAAAMAAAATVGFVPQVRSTSSNGSSSPPVNPSSHATSVIGGNNNNDTKPLAVVSNNGPSNGGPATNVPEGNAKKYQCKMCPQIFGSKADLQLHTQAHMREAKPYKCKECPKSFANSSYLSQHARIHLNIKPYSCEVCQRRFTQLSHLQQHHRTHTGDKPYKCKVPGCPKAFSQLSNLQSHSRCHQTDKPFKCNACYKCFSDEAALLEHIPKHKESKHLKTHICKFCGKSYIQETYLIKHMNKHTDKGAAPTGKGRKKQNSNNQDQQQQQQQQQRQDDQPPGGFQSPQQAPSPWGGKMERDGPGSPPNAPAPTPPQQMHGQGHHLHHPYLTHHMMSMQDNCNTGPGQLVSANSAFTPLTASGLLSGAGQRHPPPHHASHFYSDGGPGGGHPFGPGSMSSVSSFPNQVNQLISLSHIHQYASRGPSAAAVAAAAFGDPHHPHHNPIALGDRLQ